MKKPNLVEWVNHALQMTSAQSKLFPNHWTHDDYVNWATEQYHRHYPKKYEVQTWSACDGWENVWTVDGKPSIFDSAEEAQAEIDEVLETVEEQIRNGEREPEHCYDRDDYRIKEVQYVKM